MAEEPRDSADRQADAARLRDLEERLSKVTAKPEAAGPMAGYDKAHVAWRMVTEIVAGIMLGAGIGYGLDWLFGTLPIMLPEFYHHFPTWVQTIFHSGISSSATTKIMAPAAKARA